MTDLICPFSAALLNEDYVCQHAQPIVRRGGSEIACNDASLHCQCSGLQSMVRQASLERLNLEDDLLSLPHAQLVKIQYGTLNGLCAALNVQPDDLSGKADVSMIMQEVGRQHGNNDTLPVETCVDAVITTRLPRKRSRH